VPLTLSIGELDPDLTAIGALSPSDDDVIQRKAGAWTNRTMAQLAADLPASGGLQSATVTLSSAQLLDLHNTPVTLVAAPGAGKFIRPVSVSWLSTHVTTAYTNGNSDKGPVLGWVSGQNITGYVGDILFASSRYGFGASYVNYCAWDGSNAALRLQCYDDGYPFEAGDGTLTVWLDYAVEDVP